MRNLLCFLLASITMGAQDGAAIYKAHCAQCHDMPTGRVPPVSSLRAMSPANIMQSLESGPMKPQAAGLNNRERYALVTFLASAEAKATPSSSASTCSTQLPSLATSASWSGWGNNVENTRFQSAEAAGLTAASVPKLKLKWAFGLGEGTAVRSQVAVGNGRVFAANLTGGVYSLDARTGCIQWTFKADSPVRTSIVLSSKAEAVQRIYFGDMKANVYALDASTGRLVWKTHVPEHFAALLTGTPLLHGGTLYVPVASYEEVLAGSPTYECCTFRGSVVALDAATGKTIWKTYTIAEPSHPTTKTPTGIQMHGPAGASVWSTPTFDEKRNVLYVATGDNYSEPSTMTSDAVLALDATSGKLLWSKQATQDDVYNMGANAKGRDFDFGQPPILVSLAQGNRALVIGQKSGLAYAFDPDRKGEILWQARVGNGGPLGGIQWGSAVDGEKMYAAVSDLAMTGVADKSTPEGYRLELDGNKGGGLVALRLSDGKKVWSAKPVGCAEHKQCSPAQSAPVTAIPGVVFSGSEDGHLRAYSADTGQTIWDFDTGQSYQSVNGQKAHGGSLDVGGPVIAEGVLYVGSGYGQWGGMPGNVLLAFSVDVK